MSDKQDEDSDIFDALNQLIDDNQFDIETIDHFHPSKRAQFYQKLRELIEENIPDIIEQIKFAGKEQLDQLEKSLKLSNDIYRLRILKVVRAIFYC